MAKKNKNFFERIDEMMGCNEDYEHRTLRTVFDSFSSEWDDTDMEEKVEILKKMVDSGMNIGITSVEFLMEMEDLNKKISDNDVLLSISAILEYVLKNRST